MADILGFPHGPRPGDTYPPTENPNESPPELVNRVAWNALQTAANMIEGDRHTQHGKAEKCHGEIAKLWTWWTGIQLDAHDVAMMMDLLKTARIKTGGPNADCYDDKLGYTGLAKQFRFPD